MALSNAERQARHRERTKEKLRNAIGTEALRNENDVRKEFADALLERLSRAYFGSADRFRQQISGDHIDEYVDGAIGEFSEEQFSFDDIIKIIELAGYARLTEFFSLHCGKSDLPAKPPEWVRHDEELKKRGVT